MFASNALKRITPPHHASARSLLLAVYCFAVGIGARALTAQEAVGPLTPEQAARTMLVPDGFNVTLFAGEPDVQQPVGFCFDDRGRMWVAEAYNYPNFGSKPGDRIVILEDADGDGKSDRRTVFYDQLNYVTGIEVGFGGVWVMSPPNFYFIPDRNGDDVPDGQPEVLLDGFGTHANSHNLANGFAWGPDGWLYGTHGRTNWSRIAKPGTPDAERPQFDGGVYRYHPVKHHWEPYADGTTNPWGIDWNDVGEGFVSNCVNPHLFHVIQGAHYEPWRNRESSRHAYERIATIADHLHYLGSQDFHAGIGSAEEDILGGGHAHCGTMVYLGDNWPDKYRNTIFMNNIHGKRVNNDLLRRAGSGYAASHAPDIIRSQDPWHVGVTIQYGPDGGVFFSDWSDTGECHSVRNTQRETGRVFKVMYGNIAHQPIDITSLPDDELVKLHLHTNDWQVRHARRVLQERAAAGRDMTQVREALLAMFEQHGEVPRKLRAMWTLHALGGIDDAYLLEQLNHESEYVRAWTIRLLCENFQAGTTGIEKLAGLAASDSSAYVRLHLASALQRLPLDDRWQIASSLLKHAEDAADQNLPLMIWYAIEPLVDSDLQRFVQLAQAAQIPLDRNHIARRVASHPQGATGLDAMAELLIDRDESAFQLDLLNGMLRGLEGRRSVPMPKSWTDTFAKLQASQSAEVRLAAIELALVFNDARALNALRKLAVDRAATATDRQRAVRSLVAKKDAGAASLLIQLVDDAAVQSEAIRGLAEFNEAATPGLLIANYAKLDSPVRQDALQTLASRATWGAMLMDAVEASRIPRKDVTAFTARQLLSLGDAKLNARIARTWGEMRTTPADKTKLIDGYRKRLTADNLKRANLAAGRALFDKNCASCHRMFGAGGTIGPEITGAQRTNLDYVLENLIDPSAAVSKDFQMEVILTEAGRVITGLIIDESDQALTIQTANERLIVPQAEIEQRTLSQVSMMPDGLLQTLSHDQVRDLIGYLASPVQIPPPSTSGEQK
jgi:putative membrane-bound dehydrogenase-like protein